MLTLNYYDTIKVMVKLKNGIAVIEN